MRATTIAAAILIVLGIQGLAYGAFNFSVAGNKTGSAALAAQAHRTQKVVVPLCFGAGGVLIGGLLLLVGGRKPD